MTCARVLNTHVMTCTVRGAVKNYLSDNSRRLLVWIFRTSFSLAQSYLFNYLIQRFDQQTFYGNSFFSSTTHVKNALYIFFSQLVRCKLHQKTNSCDLCWFILIAFENIKVYWQQYFKNCGLSFRKRNKDMTHNKPYLTSSLLLIFSC